MRSWANVCDSRRNQNLVNGSPTVLAWMLRCRQHLEDEMEAAAAEGRERREADASARRWAACFLLSPKMPALARLAPHVNTQAAA